MSTDTGSDGVAATQPISDVGDVAASSTRTIHVGLCIPVRVEITGRIDERGELEITHCQVPGESLEPRQILEHVTDDDCDMIAEALRHG